MLMLLWAPKVFTDLAEALSEGCVGSPLHHFSLFFLLLLMLPWALGSFHTNLAWALSEGRSRLLSFASFFSVCSCLCSPFNFQTWAWCCLYRILYEDFVIFLILSSLLHLSLTLRRPILHRGPWVGPVTWPWRAGTAPAMPPRSQQGGTLNRWTQRSWTYLMASVFPGSCQKVLTDRGQNLNWGSGQNALCCVEGKLEVMRFYSGAAQYRALKDSNSLARGTPSLPSFFPSSIFWNYWVSLNCHD